MIIGMEIISDQHLLLEKIKESKSIFIKYWNTYSSPLYKKSILPGIKEGVSGSCIGGFNIGINKYSDNDKIKAASEVLIYMTSEKIQRKLVMENIFYSAIQKFYSDEELCKKLDCDFIKKIQPILQSNSEVTDYFEYYNKCKSYIYEFLYGETSAVEILNKIRDMTKIYFVSYKSKDSFLGLTIMIILCSISFIMLLSLTILFINKYKPLYNFLAPTFWIIFILGCILVISTCFTYFGYVTQFKCQLKIIFISYGVTFNSVPILHKLISNFPEENKISNWVSSHKFLFLLIFILYDSILIGLSFISPFTIETLSSQYGQQFQKCKLSGTLGKIVIYILFFSKFIYYTIIILLIFIEWNIENTQYDVKYLIVSIYLNILSGTLLMIVIQSKLNDYRVYFVMRVYIILLFSLSNYIFIYLIKIFVNKKINEEEVMIKEMINNFKYSIDDDNNNSRYLIDGSRIQFRESSDNKHSSLSNITSKLLQYHYNKSISTRKDNIKNIKTIISVSNSDKISKNGPMEVNSMVNSINSYENDNGNTNDINFL